MRMKKLHALLAALLPLATLPVLPAQAGLDCDNGFCVQSYYFTGTPQTFEVPDGIGTIRYEIYGASGARGGAGALAQGYLTNLPEQLIIEVGGAGPMGSFRPGGYNGGGASGGSRNNEGAGGGASDIRLTGDLESRIVVAGGGGGGGGYAGGAGGPGGLVGGDGTDGQGLGGKGGSLSGGLPGVNNSTGYLPQAGSFGLGGAGGSGSRAGGGGGGGGWYGGGGGGGDDDPTGTDGGGGGGGSSFAHSDYTSNASFESGVNWGHGRVLLYYQMLPSVVQFTGSQVDRTEMSFDLVMNQYIQNLTTQDFSFASGSCEVNRVSINLNTANIRLRNCSNGEIGLTLNAMSVGEWEVGPLTNVTAIAMNDLVGPSLTISEPQARYSTSSVVLSITYSDLIPVPDYFSVTGCELSISTSEIVLGSCSEGVQEVSVVPNMAVDSWGNSGPSSQSLSFIIDQTAPSMSAQTTFSGDVTFSYELQLQFSETVVIEPDAISFSSTTTCSQQVNAQSQICGYGTFSWSVNLASISDLVGHAAGSEVLVFEVSNLEPVSVLESQSPEAEPAPVAQPQPAQPLAEVVQPEPQPQPVGPPIVVEPTPASEISVSESVTISETASASASPTTSGETVSEEIEALLPEDNGPWNQFDDFLGQDLLATATTPVDSVGKTQVPSDSGSRAEPMDGGESVTEKISKVEPDKPTAKPTAQAVSGPEIELEERESFPWTESLILLALLGLFGFGAYRTIGR